jgi:hypothetical protein
MGTVVGMLVFIPSGPETVRPVLSVPTTDLLEPSGPETV